jgi:hypothetical protein
VQRRPAPGISRLPLTAAQLRLAAAATCAAVSFAIYFPGTLDPDSTTQLQEALSGRFTDWHPPIMAAFWRLLGNIAPGPAPLLAVHVGLYWLGVWALWDAAARRGGWRQILPLIAMAHPLMLVMLGAIQKDVGLAASLSAAFGLLYRQRSLGRPLSIAKSVIVGVLLAYAVLVRWNGALAAGPLLLWWIAPESVRAGRAIIVTALLGLVMVPAASFVDHSMLKASRTHAQASLELFDMAGIAHFSGDRALLDVPPGCYRPYFWDPLDSPQCGHLFERLAATDEGASALTRRWLEAIATHPLAYATHRLAYFNSSTAFAVSPTLRCQSAPDYTGCEQPRARQIVNDFVKKNLLYWPCLWLAAGGWLLVRGRADPGPRALAWSGMIYGLGYFLIGVATDWRYYLWTTLAIALALALHFASVEEDGRGFKLLKELLHAVAPVVVAGYAARLLFVIAGS